MTAVCTMSAIGFFVPAMLIFPRVRMKDELLKDAPAGTLGRCSPSGYIDGDLFLEYLKHFVTHVKCDPTNKVILILDGHKSHTKNLKAVSFARENGIILLSLPPHTTHRLQPLDVAFFKPMNTYFDNACINFLRSHPGQVITEWNIASLFNTAYLKAASLQVAVNGFRVCGIYPYNPDIFQECDYAPAMVTDQPLSSTNEPDGTTLGTVEQVSPEEN